LTDQGDILKKNLSRTDRLAVLRIVSIYAVIAAVWIYISDSALGLLVKDEDTLIRISVYKGMLFIIVTALILHHLIAKYVREARQWGELLKEANDDLETRIAERTAELDNSRAELEMQNEELMEAYWNLEKETANRIRVMEELRQKDELMLQQSRMAAMGEMLGNIAHQWRQPLNVLGLKIQQLGLSYEYGDFSKELLDANIDKVMEIVNHLSQTIDDFREFASQDKQKSLFSVDQVIMKTISIIEDSFKEQGITIDVVTSGNPQINGYQNEFEQVLLNILMNSRDVFDERGTEDARIIVCSRAEDGRSVVTISDNAGGIGEEIVDKIFDAYFTTKKLGKGTGIGLFMSKTIIEKNMGGRLTVRNVAGGAEFRIEV